MDGVYQQFGAIDKIKIGEVSEPFIFVTPRCLRNALAPEIVSVIGSGAAWGREARDGMETAFNSIFDQVLAYAAGKPINVVNPEVLQKK